MDKYSNWEDPRYYNIQVFKELAEKDHAASQESLLSL